MAGYYFPIEIHGVAVIYSDSEYEARKNLEKAKVSVAGNYLRHPNIEILDGKGTDLADAITKLEKSSERR